MAMREYTTFPIAQGLEPHHQMFYSHIQGICCEVGSYHSAEMQLAYSTTQADWVYHRIVYALIFLTNTQAHLIIPQG